MEEEVTYHYINDDPKFAPIKYDVVFLGIDLGSNDMTVYCRYDGKAFHSITKEEYENARKL